jgi:predicted dehydrogenase
MNVDDFLQRDLSRRQFLGRSAQKLSVGMAAGMVGLAGAASLAKDVPSERVGIGVIGVRNQGKALASGFARRPDAQVVSLCDVDEAVLAAAAQVVQHAQASAPRLERDFRQLLDDPQVDAVVIATPDHWHARMTELACAAGKDVYLETPVCHFGAEAEGMLAAAREHQRIVAAGLPHRSAVHFQSAIRLLHSGQLGKVAMARAWFVQRRQPLSSVSSHEVPAGVNFEAWLGPAPRRAFSANRFHFHWRWFWDYGSGELGVWGSQLLDVARWGLRQEWPQRVCATSQRRILDDDAETPDSLHVQFHCGDQTVIWEHRAWSNHAPEGRTAAVAFLAERGTLVVDRGGWKVYDCKEPLVSEASELLMPHLADFIACVKERRTPVADLTIGAVSAGWGQLATTAHRLGREIRVNDFGKPLGEDTSQFWNPPSSQHA